jgi:hypothetical protein
LILFASAVTVLGVGIMTNASDIVVSYDAAAGSSYRLERKLQLTDADWASASSDFMASMTGPAQFTDPGALSLGQAFYRVGVVLPLMVARNGNGTGGITSTPAGIDCGATCSANFDANSLVTLTAAADSGSSFTGWTGGGCSGTGTCQVTMTAAQSVTATFQLSQYTLTVNKSGTGSGTVTSSPAGINCGSTCSANYNYGTFVTLTPAAAVGSSFTGWSGGGCSGTGTCSVTMTAAQSVTAAFSQ